MPGETGFYVERYSGGSGGFVQLASTTAGVTSYNDMSVSSGGTYTYRVRAFNATDISAYSAQAMVTAIQTYQLSSRHQYRPAGQRNEHGQYHG